MVMGRRDVVDRQCAVAAVECASASLRRASRTLNQVYAKSLAPSGLQPTQFTLLVASAVAGAVPMTTLADALAMDRTTLSRNLGPLEKQGLVLIAEGDDRRVRVVHLTRRGRAALTAALPLWKKAQQQVADAFGRDRLNRVLQELGALESAARDR